MKMLLRRHPEGVGSPENVMKMLLRRHPEGVGEAVTNKLK